MDNEEPPPAPPSPAFKPMVLKGFGGTGSDLSGTVASLKSLSVLGGAGSYTSAALQPSSVGHVAGPEPEPISVVTIWQCVRPGLDKGLDPLVWGLVRLSQIERDSEAFRGLVILCALLGIPAFGLAVLAIR